MASAVKSKIASFENHNQNVRSLSPKVQRSSLAGSDSESMSGRNATPSPSRAKYSPSGKDAISRDPSGHQRSIASPVATPSAQYPRSHVSTSRNHDTKSSSRHNGKNGVKGSFSNSSSVANGSLNGLEQLPFRGGNASGAADIDDGISESGSFTSAASASRKTRLRQQRQLETAPATHHHPVNLMEKRNQIKQRRMRVAGAAATPVSIDHVSNSETTGASHNNDVAVKYSSATATATTAVSSSGRASKNMSRRMIAARKAANRSSAGAKSKHDEKATSPRLNHFHGTAPVITPSQYEETTNAISQSRSESSDAHVSDEASSPDRRESRRLKMMRVQRMKGNADSTAELNNETSHDTATNSRNLSNGHSNAGDGDSNNDAAVMSQHMRQAQNSDTTANITSQTQGRGQVSTSNGNMNKKRSKRKSTRNRESIASSTMTTATMSTAVAGGAGGAGDVARQSMLREEAIHAQSQRLQHSQDHLPLHSAEVNNYKARASSPAPTSRQHPQNATMLSTPPGSQTGNAQHVHSRNVALEPAGITLSPQIDGSEPGFSPLMGTGMSPRSGTDVCSDINDTSVLDPTVMDDEATLTSVRRIMAPKSTTTHSMGRGAHDDIPYDQRPRRDADGYLQGDENQNSLSSKQDGVFRSGPGDTPTSQYSGRNRGGLRRNGGSWLEDEKSDKGGHHGVFQTASSSDYDTDGDISKTSNTGPLTVGQSHSQATDVTEFFNSARGSRYNSRRQADDDDRTFDYGDREDDESNASASYAARRRREAERRPRESEPMQQSQQSYKNGSGNHANTPDTPRTAASESHVLNHNEVDRVIETPAFKVGVGVVGSAAVGCMILGPVGVLVGAAAVGIGVGVMQIPEEQRNDMQDRAKQTMHKIHDKACDATEALSTSCVAHYKESGVADHLPHCLSGSDAGGTVVDDHVSTHSESARRQGKTDGTNSVAGGAPNHHLNPSNLLSGPETTSAPASATSQNSGRGWRNQNQKVACLREVRITPVGQIHALDPASQPRAWLDVMASADTSEDEKNEAMEEILILAKDKSRARIFLDEGILDSLMWILNRYFEKVHGKGKENNWAHPEVTPNERQAAKLAAACCLTLGKAHCAAFHTGGDLLLMSMYERGTVPEERQVAQMLHEVPHHVRVTKTSDPTVVDPSQEVFALKQMTLPQAEELARAIKGVKDIN